MRLDEHAVDLIEIDDSVVLPDGLEQATGAQIFGPSDDAVCGADDQGYCLFGEAIMPEPGLVELPQDEGLHVIGVELFDGGGESDSAFDILVHLQGKLHEQA